MSSSFGRLDLTTLLPAQKSGARSFSFQYMALILIVLTMIVGSFAHHSIQKSRKLPHTTDGENQIGQLTFHKIFHTGTAEFRREDLYGISTLLSSHDVRIKAKISNLVEEQTHGIPLSVARSIALLRHFRDVGLPVRAVRISALAESAQDQLIVSIYKDENE